MSTLDELINHRRDIALNIIKGFEQPVDETPVFSEKDFVKAQEDGLIEVFGVDAVSAFQRKIEKALLENPDANGLLEIEKAKRDLSKLLKVKKVDSRGRTTTVYVRATPGNVDQKKYASSGTGVQTKEGLTVPRNINHPQLGMLTHHKSESKEDGIHHHYKDESGARHTFVEDHKKEETQRKVNPN